MLFRYIHCVNKQSQYNNILARITLLGEAMRNDWRTIEGFDNYQINSEGVVISCCKREQKKVLKPQKTSNGYLHIRLYKNGIQHTKKLHRLVYETFVGEIPKGYEVLHGPGYVRDNCCVEYLSVGTRAKNMEDKIRDGTDNKGVKHWKAKLTERQVVYIKQRLADGMTQKSLASLFQVARITISDIARGKNWKHLCV